MFYTIEDTLVSIIAWLIISLACITVATRKYTPTWKTRIVLSLLATGMAAILQFIVFRLKPGADFIYASFFATVFICLMIVVKAYKNGMRRKA